MANALKWILLLFPVPLMAQVSNPPIIPQASLPGSCTNGNLPLWLTTSALYICVSGVPTALGGGGSGTVTSVTFTGDGVVDSSTPSTAVTTSGTVTATVLTQSANTVFGNFTGGTAAPTFSATPTFAMTNLTGTCTNCTSNAAVNTNVPGWLTYLGDGSESAPNCSAGCTAIDEHWYASLNVPVGQIMSMNTAGHPLIIRSTGTCTIAGTISVSANTGSGAGASATTANWGGGGGGGGFGAANGTIGSFAGPNQGAGAAGTSGVSGGIGGTTAAGIQKEFASGFFGESTVNIAANGSGPIGGAHGGAGGSSGGAGGIGGSLLVLACQTINFTGTIDASGVNGGAGGSSTGGGGGGGGGIVILRSPNMTNSGTINVAHGAGGAIGTGTSTAGGNGGDGFSKVFSQ